MLAYVFPGKDCTCIVKIEYNSDYIDVGYCKYARSVSMDLELQTESTRNVLTDRYGEHFPEFHFCNK